MEKRGYQSLVAWQKAFALAAACYSATRAFPRAETFALGSQIQRAATSVPANIAEGQARESTRAFLNHLSIACGSLAELETHILLATHLGYINSSQSDELLQRSAEVARILAGLKNSLRRKLKSHV
jgi:four helix bundle protein